MAGATFIPLSVIVATQKRPVKGQNKKDNLAVWAAAL